MKLAVPAILLIVSACSPDPQQNSTATSITTAATPPKAPAAPKSPEQAFADQSAATDAFAMAAGNLAKAKAVRPDVKAFGIRVFDEHVQAMMRLKAAAAKVPGVLVDPTLPPELMADITTLQSAQGAAFDTAFVSQQVALHERSLKAMQNYAARGGDAGLRDYADYNSRRVRSRLDRVREL